MKLLPIFFVKREYLEAIERGEKKAEIRIGKRWARIARAIENGKIKPIAIFVSGSRRIVMHIKRVEVYPTIKSALRSKRWKKLGLKAMSFKSAVNEIRKLYGKTKRKPVVIFWLK